MKKVVRTNIENLFTPAIGMQFDCNGETYEIEPVDLKAKTEERDENIQRDDSSVFVKIQTCPNCGKPVEIRVKEGGAPYIIHRSPSYH